MQALRFLVIGFGTFVLCVCTLGHASAESPNILFLLTDDQRPDTIGYLGNDQIKTPNLDRLAKEGTTFTRAVCANPICTPSRAEIITGCSGFTNGVFDFGRTIDPKLATWANTLKQAGYRTVYVGKWHNNGLPADHGYEDCIGLYAGGGGKWAKEQTDWKGSPITGYRGWIFQSADRKELYPEKGVGLTGDISAKFADAAIEFLNRKENSPFFLQVCFTAPHDPLVMPPGYEKTYDPSSITLPKNYLPRHPFDHGNFEGRDERLLPWPREPEAVRDVIAMYYRVISHLDEQIGRILKTLEATGQAKNTLVIFSSDHGLGVGSHGIRGKQNMYEHTINVPLIFRGPGVPKDEKRNAQCYLRDLFPTTCEIARVEIPKTVEGKSLAAVIRGEEKSVYKHAFGYFRDKQRMIRGDRYKLIVYPHLDRRQLFDLTADPFELKDLSADEEHAAALAGLQKELSAWQAKVGDPLISK